MIVTMIVTHELLDCNEIIVTHELLDCNDDHCNPLIIGL